MKPKKTEEVFEQLLEKKAKEKYVLRLYVAGLTPRSQTAIKNIKKICEEHLNGRYDLEVIDVYQTACPRQRGTDHRSSYAY